MDLATATVDDFAPHTGTMFAIQFAEARIELELSSATAFQTPGVPGGRAPFRLEFRGPADPVLAQASYLLDHRALGRLAIFIVPIARDESGATYEAIFA